MSLTPEDIRHVLDNRISVDPKNLTAEALKTAGCIDRVCVLPEAFNERVSYLGGTLVQMLTRSPKDDRLRATVGQLCQAMSYMLNSASWREGVLHDFDLDELRNKLRRVTGGDAKKLLPTAAIPSAEE